MIMIMTFLLQQNPFERQHILPANPQAASVRISERNWPLPQHAVDGTDCTLGAEYFRAAGAGAGIL